MGAIIAALLKKLAETALSKWVAGNAKIIAWGAGIVCVAGLILTIAILNGRNETLKTQRDAAVAEAKATTEAYSSFRAEAESQLKSITEARDEAMKRQTKARKREKEILHVAPTEDGTVAPVLRHSLERLR